MTSCVHQLDWHLVMFASFLIFQVECTILLAGVCRFSSCLGSLQALCIKSYSWWQLPLNFRLLILCPACMLKRDLWRSLQWAHPVSCGNDQRMSCSEVLYLKTPAGGSTVSKKGNSRAERQSWTNRIQQQKHFWQLLLVIRWLDCVDYRDTVHVSNASWVSWGF